MKRTVLGFLVGAGLVALVIGTFVSQSEVFAQRSSPYRQATADSELMVMSSPVGDRVQQLTVVDPRQRVVAVYHVDSASGKIALKAVRNIHWDLQMLHLNNENPLPREIQMMLEQR